MSQFGFYFDQENCVGCRTCQVACKDRNNLPVGELFRTVTSYETGTYPNAVLYHYAATCNHCDSPACADACPTGAMQKNEDGTVYPDPDVCIGCESCVSACPYEIPVISSETGVSTKCDGCKAFRDRGLNPVCVDACPMRALEWGEMSDLRAAHPDAVSDIACLPDSSLTNPNILIRPKQAALSGDCVAVAL